MKKYFGLLLVGLLSLALAACAPACTQENTSKFVSEVNQIWNAFDVVEFNVAFSPQAKAQQIQQLRLQADKLFIPVCADHLKTVLIQSLDERSQDIGNPSNRPRPVSDYFRDEFTAFQKASLSQLNQNVNLLTNATLSYWVVIDLVILMVLLLLGFGAFFLFSGPDKILIRLKMKKVELREADLHLLQLGLAKLRGYFGDVVDRIRLYLRV